MAQSQGIINNAFLKYRKCSTILRNEDNMNRVMNMIEKQKKKNKKWNDSDFGPNEIDQNGQYSLIYYDGIAPKEWPPFEGLKWA